MEVVKTKKHFLFLYVSNQSMRAPSLPLEVNQEKIKLVAENTILVRLKKRCISIPTIDCNDWSGQNINRK